MRKNACRRIQASATGVLLSDPIQTGGCVGQISRDVTEKRGELIVRLFLWEK